MTRILVVPAGAGSIGIIDALRRNPKNEIFAGDINPEAPGLLRESVTAYTLPPNSKEREYIERLLDIIDKECIDVLLPGYDLDVVVASKYRNRLQEAVNLLIPPHEKVRIANDTWLSVEAAREAGVPHPNSYNVGEMDLKKGTEIGFPAFVKPRSSRGGRGAHKVTTRSELRYYAERVKKNFGDPIIQEYIHGGVGSMHVVGLLYSDEGEPLSSFVCRSLRTNYSWGGGGVAGEPVEEPMLVEYAMEIINQIGGWIGPVNMEFKMDVEDGTPKFMEINPRLWGYNFIATLNGMNLPQKIVDIALGREVDPQHNYDLDTLLLIDYVEQKK